MEMVWNYKPGYSVPGTSPQVAGEALREIERANDGKLTAEVVVATATPEDHPLHPAFEWDDAVAARQHREEQARHLIRSVYPVHIDSEGRPQPVLGYVNVKMPDGERCYVSTARAMSDAELKRQVEEEAIRAFEALRARYQHIVSLGPIFQALDAVKARKTAKRRREEVQAAAP